MILVVKVDKNDSEIAVLCRMLCAWRKLMELRQIKSSKEKQQYRELCKYCFVDKTGWTDSMLNDPKEDSAVYGAFEDKLLKSAIISRHYSVNLFGSMQKMAGISAVASYPEVRNKGYVRAIITQILEDEREAGRTLSCLYPFSFSYYAKFGYGSMGEFRHVSFSPLDLLPVKDAQALLPFDGSGQMLKDLHTVKTAYLQRFDFSAFAQVPDVKKYTMNLLATKKKLYLSYRDGKACGALIYELRPLKPHASELVLNEIYWTSPEGLRDIIAHLRAHRDQCEKISGNIQESVPFHLLCTEPRLPTEVWRSWMARPLKLQTLLEAKLADEASKTFTPFSFSVEDAQIPEETATYKLSPDGIQKKAHDGTNPVSLPVLSALLFGGMSTIQAVDAGLCDGWITDHRDFFAKKRGNCLNEHF